MLKIEKQGKKKGRGTGRVEMRVCTRGWRGTRLEVLGASAGTMHGTECGTFMRSAMTGYACTLPAIPDSRR